MKPKKERLNNEIAIAVIFLTLIIVMATLLIGALVTAIKALLWI